MAAPSGSRRLSVIARLLRCRFWKSGPWRLPPIPSPERPPGISILIARAPQSTSWRTQVGPARARVRSRTLKRARGRAVFSAMVVGSPRPGGEPGGRVVAPAEVARRGTVRQAASEEPERVLVAAEPQGADHHRLLEQLPLRVAAADAVELGLDRLQVGEGGGVIAGDEGSGALD